MFHPRFYYTLHIFHPSFSQLRSQVVEVVPYTIQCSYVYPSFPGFPNTVGLSRISFQSQRVQKFLPWVILGSSHWYFLLQCTKDDRVWVYLETNGSLAYTPNSELCYWPTVEAKVIGHTRPAKVPWVQHSKSVLVLLRMSPLSLHFEPFGILWKAFNLWDTIFPSD